jgi:hypothetical protein
MMSIGGLAQPASRIARASTETASLTQHIRDRSMAATHIEGMTLDLTDGEAATLARLLRRTIDEDRYPLSPASLAAHA